MPLLGGWRLRHGVGEEARGGARHAPLFPACANPLCASGRLHLWRNRRAPVIESGWVCSPACTLARVQAAVSRELAGGGGGAGEHQHRVPLGLILLAQGWIDHDQLKRALRAQRQGEPGRIGAWLIAHCGLEEQRVTQALSLQWNCPVYTGEPDAALLTLCPVPRIFLDATGVLPLRLAATGLLYIAFEDRIDHSFTLALERMTGWRVEAGLLGGSEFRRYHARMLMGNFVRARLLEADSGASLAGSLAGVVEKTQPEEARLVRVHRFLWLRMWRQAGGAAPGELPGLRQAEDVIGTIAGLD
jgi:hypothetical protein